MTYATALATGRSTKPVYALVIDGIPLLFGTQGGYSVTSPFVSQPTGALTSVAALLPGGGVDGQEFDPDTLMVPPGGAKLRIKGSTAWDKYFEPRRTPQTRLITRITGASTSMNVVSNTNFTNGGLLYVDRECMLIDTLTPPGVIAITYRNYAELAGARGNAVHQAGAYVTAVPLSMLGRRADLYAFSSETDYTLLRRLRISHVQHSGDTNVWEISFSDIMEVFDRPVAVNMEGAAVAGINLIANNQLYVNVNSNTTEFGNVCQDLGSVMLQRGETYDICDMEGVSVAGPLLDAGQFSNAIGVGYRSSAAVFDNDVIARRVYVFQGPPMAALLKILLSDRGNLENHGTYDTLWGRTAESGGTGDTLQNYEVEKRFGAAIPPELLNLTTTGDGLLNPLVLSETPSGFSLVLGAESDEGLLEIMRQVAWALQGFFYVNSDGKLSFKRLSGTYSFTSVTAALTETDVLRVSPLGSVCDESAVLHTLAIECNWDHAERKYLTKVNVRYPRTHETYKDAAGVLEFKSKCFVFNVPPRPMYAYGYGAAGATLADLVSRFSRTFYDRQRGKRRYEFDLPWRYHTLVPGDVITVTHSALKAFDGSTLSALKLLVTGVTRLDLETGTVTIRTEDTWSGKPLSPTGKVSSWTGGTFTLTLATSDKFSGSTTPGRYFAAGWKVKVLDASASPPFSTISGVKTVSSVTDTTVVLTSWGEAWTPASGDIVVQADYDNADNTTTSSTLGIDQRGHAFMADANFRLGTSDVTGDTWS